MKKQKTLTEGISRRADGRPIDYASSGTFSNKDRAQLKLVASCYTGARISTKSPKHVFVKFGSTNKEAYEALYKLVEKKCGAKKYENGFGNADGLTETRLKYSTEAAAKKACNLINAIIHFGKNCDNYPEEVIEPGYVGGGKRINHAGYSFYIPYEEGKAANYRAAELEEAHHNAEIGELNQQTAEASNAAAQAALQQSQAEADKLALDTKTGVKRTAMIIGFAAIALLVVGAVILIVVKKKKK